MVTKQLVMCFAVVALLCGCAENRSSFFVVAVLEPDDECRAEPNEGGPFITQGYLDVAYSRNYVFFPMLSNQLSSRSDEQSLVVETNGIQVSGANVRFWHGGLCQGDTFYEFYQPAACYVSPNGLSSCGFTVAPPTAVNQAIEESRGGESDDPEILATLSSSPVLISASIEMLGTTNGGQELTTPEFCFTINLYYTNSTLCPIPDESGYYCSGSGVTIDDTDGCFGHGEWIDCCVYGELWCAANCFGL